MTFEWDDEKADKNRRKHGLHFSQVLGVFNDLRAVEFLDEEHSSEREMRYAIIGLTARGLLYVVFTEQEPGVIRILHARRADRRMARIYEGKEK